MFFEYVKWHYGCGFNDFTTNIRNFFFFLIHFFSFRLFLKTFFSPWKRMGERYEKGLHIESLASTFLVNLIMRVVGMIARLVLGLLGVIILFCFMITSFVATVMWLLMPALLAVVLSSGLLLIYASI